MDLKFSADDEAFRYCVREWLKKSLARDQATAAPGGALAQSKAWQRKLYEAGFVGLAWPKRYGGQEAPPTQQAILNEEMARAGAPPLINTIGLTIFAPTLIQFGTEEQKRRFLPKILTAEEIWCQGFSEPGAGSDLASLQTRAVDDGDDFVVAGQKVWTSLGPIADWCFLLVRTDTTAAKQDGISYLLMDMKSPGVTVRPLRQITGKTHFSELFLEEVRIPKANLVGEKNRGWVVAKASLSHERSGLAGVVEIEKLLSKLVVMARAQKRGGKAAIESPLFRQRLAQLYIEKEALKYIGYRVLSVQARGAEPGPEASVGKLLASEMRQRMMEVALSAEGQQAQVMKGSSITVDRGKWQMLYLDARAYTIGGGTSEVMRNIIAERILGLPRSAE